MSTAGLGEETELADDAAAMPEQAVPVVAGQFMVMAFFGHIEHTGYVTEVTFHGGEPGYRIDLPEKLWGGNPMAYREYAASAMFSRWPVDEASVLAAWKAEQARAERIRAQELAWDRERAAAIAAGPSLAACTCGWDPVRGRPDRDPDCPLRDAAHAASGSPF